MIELKTKVSVRDIEYHKNSAAVPPDLFRYFDGFVDIANAVVFCMLGGIYDIGDHYDRHKDLCKYIG